MVTASTTTFAYFINFEEYALFTLISHDLSDSILNYSKFVRDISQNDILLTIFMVLVIVTWVLMRIILAARCYWTGTDRLFFWKDPYGPKFTPEWDAVKYGVNIVCVETLLLLLLNFIWLYWILQIAYRKVFKGAKLYSSVQEGEGDELQDQCRKMK